MIPLTDESNSEEFGYKLTVPVSRVGNVNPVKVLVKLIVESVKLLEFSDSQSGTLSP